MKELIIWHFYKSNKILTIINPYMSERNYTSVVRAENQKFSVLKNPFRIQMAWLPHAFLSQCICKFIQHSDCPSWGRRINTGVSENLFCINCYAHSTVLQLVASERTNSQRWTQGFCCFLMGVGVWSAISLYQPWSLKGHFCLWL